MYVMNTGLRYLACYCRSVKQMLLYFSIQYIFSSAAVIRKSPSLCFLVFITVIHKFGQASAREEPYGLALFTLPQDG